MKNILVSLTYVSSFEMSVSGPFVFPSPTKTKSRCLRRKISYYSSVFNYLREKEGSEMHNRYSYQSCVTCSVTFIHIDTYQEPSTHQSFSFLVYKV